jgi:type IV pilus assembly protein PilB
MSTLHTDSAPETLGRLLDMGVERYHLAGSLTLVIAQRLVRKLCEQCRKPLKISHKPLIKEGFPPEILDTARFHEAVGCEKCQGGYKGRIGIHECLPITEAVSRVIMDGGNSIQIADMARKDGFNSLRASALEKAALGVTTLAEVNRIT